MRWMIPTLLVLAGAACGPAGSPCADARHGCGSSLDGFQLDTTCELTEPLEVELGHGESSFTPLDDGRFPTLHHGSQGGTHVYLAVRVLNPALDRYDKLKARFRIYTIEACEEDGGGEPLDGSSNQCRYLWEGRNVILGQSVPLRVVDGVVEEYGVLVQTSSAAAYQRQIEVQIEDPCGRTGVDDVDIPPG